MSAYSDCRDLMHTSRACESDGTHPLGHPGKTVTLTDRQLPRRATTSPPETVSVVHHRLRLISPPSARRVAGIIREFRD